MGVDDRLSEIFIEESAALVAELEEGLMALDDAPDDADLIDRVFRSAHSIKGGAGMFGATAIVEVAHVLETVLDGFRGGTMRPEAGMTDTLLKIVDSIKSLLAQFRAGEPPALSVDDRERLSMVQTLNGLSKRGAAVDDDAQESVSALPVPSVLSSIFSISMRFRDDILETGQDPILLIDELATLGELISVRADLERLPSFDALDIYTTYIKWTLRIKTTQTIATVKNVFIFIEDDNFIDISDVTDRYADDMALEDANKCIGELLVEEGHVTKRDVEDALGQQKRTGEILIESGKVSSETVQKVLERQQKARQWLNTSAVRVRSAKLDQLVDLVGEMVIAVAQLKRTIALDDVGKDEKIGAAAELASMTRDLHEQVLSARMIPIESVFKRFKRVIRDLATDLGKDVQLITEGQETELDKTLIEQLADPLTHLVRNSVGHGIEPPDERLRAGKPPRGTVTLTAGQRQGKIHITVADDGRGIDIDKVFTKARQLGLVDGTVSPSPERAFELLFEPGMSTADSVNEISGRGVGLDVVRQNISALRGAIEVSSDPGKGATFHIQIPLTLAIIDGMHVKVGRETLTVPIRSITELLRPKKEHLRTVTGRGELFWFRGDYLPLVRLYSVFDFETEQTDPASAIVLVLGEAEARWGLMVDEVLGEDQVLIKTLDTDGIDTTGLAGATILASGEVSLILDTQAIAEMAFARKARDVPRDALRA